MSIDLHNVTGAVASTTVFSDIPVTASTTATLAAVSGNTTPALVVDIILGSEGFRVRDGRMEGI